MLPFRTFRLEYSEESNTPHLFQAGFASRFDYQKGDIGYKHPSIVFSLSFFLQAKFKVIALEIHKPIDQN
jgi:hypothetical protein